MNKFLIKDLATSLTTFLFIAIGTSGVLMYFHILDKYIKELHEIIGLAFVVIVFFHVFFNWKSMKNYFKKKVFLFSAIVIFIVSLGFIFTAPEGDNAKRTIVFSVLSAPLDSSLSVLNTDYEKAKEKLESVGLKMGDAKTFQEVARLNRTSPFNIISIITEK